MVSAQPHPSYLTAHAQLRPPKVWSPTVEIMKIKSGDEPWTVVAQTEKPHYHCYGLLIGGDKESKEARSGRLTNGCAKSCDAEGRSSGSTRTHWRMKS